MNEQLRTTAGMIFKYAAFLLLIPISALAADAPPGPAFNRVRFFPAPKAEQAMVGGKFEGSNVSRCEGFEVLSEDLTWFGAFYRESPEDTLLPIGTTFTPEQVSILQRLAWNVIKNYPDCGLYEEGTAPVGKPEFAPGAKSTEGVTPVTLGSSTPGAWFRYTLDGTTPTRTRGYVYCGVISARPGMTVKAIAYRSGMADSVVSETSFP